MPYLLPIIALLALLIPDQAAAEPLLRECTETGNCGICDIAATAVTIGKWLITGSAGLALVVIVSASIGMIASAGNAEKTGAAKKQILGAVFGVGIVFAAFYLVLWIVMAFANPSNQWGYTEDAAEGAKVTDAAGLRGFLGGAAWWDLCSEEDLRKNSDTPGSVNNTTADCKFWGDDTSCSDKENKVCCSGTCQDAPCVPNIGVASYQAGQAAEDEAEIRARLGNIIQKNPCQGTNTVGCANVAGLPELTIVKLLEAATHCTDCIVITGGTEPGHVSHGPRKDVVDIAYSQNAKNALEAIGVRQAMPNFGKGYTCEANGGPSACDAAQWLHVEF